MPAINVLLMPPSMTCISNYCRGLLPRWYTHFVLNPHAISSTNVHLGRTRCYRPDSRRARGMQAFWYHMLQFSACTQKYLSKSSDNLAVLWFDTQRMRKVALALFCRQAHPVCSIRKHDQQSRIATRWPCYYSIAYNVHTEKQGADCTPAPQ